MHVAGIFPEQPLPKHMWIAISALLSKNLLFFFIIYIFPKKQRVSQNLGEYITRDLFTRMIKIIKRKVRTQAPRPKNKEPGAKEEESVLYLQSGLFYYLTTIFFRTYCSFFLQ